MVFRVYVSAFGYYSTMPGSKECLWLLGDGLVQVKTPERRQYWPICPTHSGINSPSLLSPLYWILISSAHCSLGLFGKLRAEKWKNQHN